ncbi:MAG: hypothetical protein LGB67_03690 [Sulfurovum sp.]|nr:hypothetical protein [Sulfurovum sp.]
MGVTVQPWQTQGVTASTAMGKHRGSEYSHGHTQGVRVQPWADTRGHSTVMCRHRGYCTASGRQSGSQLIQPWADTGVTVQPWADKRAHGTAMGRH